MSFPSFEVLLGAVCYPRGDGYDPGDVLPHYCFLHYDDFDGAPHVYSPRHALDDNHGDGVIAHRGFDYHHYDHNPHFALHDPLCDDALDDGDDGHLGGVLHDGGDDYHGDVPHGGDGYDDVALHDNGYRDGDYHGDGYYGGVPRGDVLHDDGYHDDVSQHADFESEFDNMVRALSVYTKIYQIYCIMP